MTISLARAKTTARRLLRENRKNRRSWRVIAREDFDDQINYATLCRFAINKGAWLPKDDRLLIILGLKKERKPRPKQKTIRQMNNREMLEAFQKRINKMNACIDERKLKATIGWIKP